MPFVISGVREGKLEKEFVYGKGFILVGECFVQYMALCMEMHSRTPI